MSRSASLRSHRLPSFQRTPERASGICLSARAQKSKVLNFELCARPAKFLANLSPNRAGAPPRVGRRRAPSRSASSYQPSGAERTGPPPVHRRLLQRRGQGRSEPVLTACGGCGSLCQDTAPGEGSGRSGDLGISLSCSSSSCAAGQDRGQTDRIILTLALTVAGAQARA